VLVIEFHLAKVKDVVAGLAINPNTVLKAGRRCNRRLEVQK
jgi:hypothetical protein